MASLVGVLASVSVARVLGMALLAFGLGGAVGLAHRHYLNDRVPAYAPVIVGLGAIGLWMNTSSALIQFVSNELAAEPGAVVLAQMETNAAAILLGGVAAYAGARAGDRVTPNVRALTGAREVEAGVSNLVRTVGRFITVKLPKAKDVEDIEGYEPVPQERKESIGGVEFVFPRGLTVAELRDRVVARLREDYGVGHVDVELDAEGTVQYLALGSREAGIGPTLPPRKVAVAVTADPAPNASPGDRVHVWQRGEDGAERVSTAELRATSGDVATLTVDASRAAAVDQSATHSVVTLPAEKQADREFAALLRAADETMGTATVAAESPLAGVPVGALQPSVVAVRPEAGQIETLPRRSRVLDAGDTLYAIGRHDELRKVETFASADPEPTPKLDREEAAGSASGARRHVRRFSAWMFGRPAR